MIKKYTVFFIVWIFLSCGSGFVAARGEIIYWNCKNNIILPIDSTQHSDLKFPVKKKKQKLAAPQPQKTNIDAAGWLALGLLSLGISGLLLLGAILLILGRAFWGFLIGFLLFLLFFGTVTMYFAFSFLGFSEANSNRGNYNHEQHKRITLLLLPTLFLGIALFGFVFWLALTTKFFWLFFLLSLLPLGFAIVAIITFVITLLQLIQERKMLRHKF